MKMENRLTLQRIIENDPLANWLSRYMNPLRFVAGGLILGSVQMLVLPAFAGVLTTSSLIDWPNLVVMLVLMPLILAWYAWQPFAILKLYQILLSRVPHPQSEGINPVVALLASHRSRGLTWLALVVTLVATTSLALRLFTETVPSWENATLALIVMRLLIRFIIFYALLMFLVRQVLVTVALNRFFKRTRISLNPLHPDQSGGLRILGSFVLNSAGLVMVVGFLLSLQYMAAHWGGSRLGAEFPFVVLSYLLAGPLVFFLPLMQVHKQMLAARNKLLVEIAEEFEQLYQNLMGRLAQNLDVADALVQLDAAEELHAVVSEAPSWPFSLAILSRFSGLIAAPILLPAAVNVVVNLFGP